MRIVKVIAVVVIVGLILLVGYTQMESIEGFFGGSDCPAIQECLQAELEESAEVYFCPEDECSEALISEIDAAETSIHAAVYSFTLDSVGGALINAHNSGVEVKIVFEEGQISQYSQYERLKEAGVDVRRDSNPSYMHNKFAVFDGKKVATGSFNWSKNADTRNDENLIILLSTELAQKYEAEFEEIYDSAVE